MNNLPKISVCIPYHSTDKTAFFLSRLLKSLHEQTFRDFEVVLTNEGNFARNHNAAIIKSKGEIIQMMQMDDYFTKPDSLESIIVKFREEDGAWQITACLHDSNGQVGAPHSPSWNDKIYSGFNTLGSVSTLSMRREHALLFEEPLQWLVDVDLYYRLYLKYGLPILNPYTNVIIDTRNDRLTHTIPDHTKLEEIEYLRKKYG